MGALIAEEELVPDLIVSSSAARAIATAEAIALTSGYEGEVEATEQLYHAGISPYFEVLRQLPTDVNTVMVVGHNPGIEDFVEVVGGQWTKMPTAALVHIELPLEDWQDMNTGVQGTIKQVWLPKKLQ